MRGTKNIVNKLTKVCFFKFQNSNIKLDMVSCFDIKVYDLKFICFLSFVFCYF